MVVGKLPGNGETSNSVLDWIAQLVNDPNNWQTVDEFPSSEVDTSPKPIGFFVESNPVQPSGSSLVHHIPVTALKWLDAIGRELADPQNINGFHRNSPTAGVVSPSKDFIVFFDSNTGVPTKIEPGSVLPRPEFLQEGTAAAHVQYVELPQAGFLTVKSRVSWAPLSQGATTVLHMIEGRQPIINEQAPEAIDLGNGVQLMKPDNRVDKHNKRFAEKLSTMRTPPMTIMVPRFTFVMGNPSFELSDWLTSRAPNVPGAHDRIADLVFARQSGCSEYDISIDAKGRFVGVSLHRDSEHPARGTTYTSGAADSTNAQALNVRLATVPGKDGREIMVPVSYEWDGPLGDANYAFERWFNSPEYVEARKTIITQEQLSELIFQGTDPRERLTALLDNLDSDPTILEGSNIPPELIPKFINELRGCLDKDSIDPINELQIAYLEMNMRNAVGDVAIDDVVAGLNKYGETPTGETSSILTEAAPAPSSVIESSGRAVFADNESAESDPPLEDGEVRIGERLQEDPTLRASMDGLYRRMIEITGPDGELYVVPAKSYAESVAKAEAASVTGETGSTGARSAADAMRDMEVRERDRTGRKK